MKKHFEYMAIAIGLRVGLQIFCTETTTLDWIEKEIGSKFQELQPRKNKSVRHYVKMDNKHHEWGFWLVQQFCHQGWEPLNTQFMNNGDDWVAPLSVEQSIFQFRKEYIVDDEQ